MKRVQFLAVVVSVASAAIVGCFRTKSELAIKPMDINLNISGRLELVITDARRQEEEITGAKPKRTVRPEDIGLPPGAAPKAEATGPGAKLTADDPGLQIGFVASGFSAGGRHDPPGQLVQ